VTELLDRLRTALPDRYRIERELDRGGLAVVFLVHDQKLNRPAHFKVFRPERAAALDARRFLEELGPAVKLRHPSISGPYRYGAAGGLLYYVVPLVKGESLHQRLTREVRLSIEQTIEITRSVAAALDYAHGEGIVHRDIRPENILLPGGQAVVADFGVARAVRIAAGERPETALSPGKPYYMSPEQVLGDEVGAPSDLYSLGATLFEVVTGEKPFDGETVQKIVAQHIANPVREPKEVVPDVPAWLSDLIVRCLQKAPEDRYQRAAEVLEALEAGAAADPSGEESAAVEDLGVGEIVQGASWDFDEQLAPEVKPPPQPIYDVTPVQESAPEPPTPRPAEPAAPPQEPVPPTAAPITTGGDLIPGAWFEPDQADTMAKPEPEPAAEEAAGEAEGATAPEEPEAAAPIAQAVVDEALAETVPEEPAPIAPATKTPRIPPWLLEAYDLGPELLVRLAKKRETWFHVARGVGVIIGVVVVFLIVKAIFFRPATVEILLDGQMVHTLEAGQQDSLVLPRDRAVDVAWRLVRPRQGRQEMGEEFEVLLSSGVRGGGTDAPSVITGVAPDRAMFAPRITNQTNRELVALVNARTPMELRCNCVIPANSQNVHIGYYPLLENSTIRFFDARRAYRGQFQEIGGLFARVDTLSGSVGITIGSF
jgi:serine/threonine protein kinase